MTYTEYLFEGDAVRSMVETMRASVLQDQGTEDFEDFALTVIRKRLALDPIRYRDYGPYWWAVKKLLNESEFYMGEDADAGIWSVYRGANAAETIVKADMFRNLYLSNFFVGANQFNLDGSGELWSLWDEDMESAYQQLSIL